VKFTYYFILFVFATSFLLPTHAQEVTAEGLVQSAYMDMYQQQLDEAERKFNRAIRINPELAAAFIGRAELRNQRSAYNAGILDINRAIELQPSSAAAYYIRGELRMNLKDYQGSLVDFNIALELDPAMQDAIAGKAIALIFLDRDKEAIQLIEDNLKRDSEAPAFYYARGMLLYFREKYSKAIEDFNRVIEIDPNYNPFNVYLNRGVTLLELLEFDEAKENLDKAITFGKERASAYHSRGRVYYKMEDYEKAVSDFNTALELNPDNDVTYYNLGMAYLRMDDLLNACESFHRSCSMDNRNSCRMVLLNCADLR